MHSSKDKQPRPTEQKKRKQNAEDSHEKVAPTPAKKKKPKRILVLPKWDSENGWKKRNGVRDVRDMFGSHKHSKSNK